MRLQDEIAALREEIAASSGRSAAADGPPPRQDDRAERGERDIEKLLGEVNAMLDDFAEELDGHPRLTAVAALCVGIVLGAALCRRLH